jgi:hypothetical protein
VSTSLTVKLGASGLVLSLALATLPGCSSSAMLSATCQEGEGGDRQREPRRDNAGAGRTAVVYLLEQVCPASYGKALVLGCQRLGLRKLVILVKAHVSQHVVVLHLHRIVSTLFVSIARSKPGRTLRAVPAARSFMVAASLRACDKPTTGTSVRHQSATMA